MIRVQTSSVLLNACANTEANMAAVYKAKLGAKRYG